MPEFNSRDTNSRTPRAWEPFIAVAIAALALALAGCGQNVQTSAATFSETKPACAATAVPNSYIVHWKDGSVSVERGYTRDDFDKEIFEPYKDEISHAEQDQLIKVTPMNSTIGNAENIRPYDQVDTSSTADDQWGQNIISVSSAWNAGVYGAGVTVAVVDSGVDITHPQLRGRLYVNTREIPGNGIDDDGNGFIDDVSGWDFDGNQPIVSDSAGHGTHVAGIILAEHGQTTVKGVAPAAKLLPLDFMNAKGEGNIGDAILAVQYAANQGARVINASWGGSPCSSALNRTIFELDAKGILFIAAAGNSGVELDQLPEYPAAFLNPNQITVGASTSRDYTAGFSNFSYKFVQLFAPGASILSTYPGNRSASLSGTSMAAPFVAGAAALLMSANPSATVSQIRAALLNSVDKNAFAASTKGRLNVRQALEALK